MPVTGIYRDPEWLRGRYWDEGLTSREVADLAGCSQRTVLRWMRKHSIPRGPENRPVLTLAGQRFGRLEVIEVAGFKNKAMTWLCRCDCGAECIVRGSRLKRGNTVSCGCYGRELSGARLRGKEGKHWEGGRTTVNGYVFAWCPDHPYAQKKGYVAEHRLVMEERLGRYLCPEETVHHLNGIRDDNRIENLELWASNHPTGARVSDLVDFALEILREYAPEMVNETEAIDD